VILVSATKTLATPLTTQVLHEVTMLNVTQLKVGPFMTFSLIMGVVSRHLTARLRSLRPVWCCVKLHGLGHVWYRFCPIITTKY
jgi:hypothetical protein